MLVAEGVGCPITEDRFTSMSYVTYDPLVLREMRMFIVSAYDLGLYRSGPPDYSMTTQQGPWSAYRYRNYTVRIIPKDKLLPLAVSACTMVYMQYVPIECLGYRLPNLG